MNVIDFGGTKDKIKETLKMRPLNNHLRAEIVCIYRQNWYRGTFPILYKGIKFKTIYTTFSRVFYLYGLQQVGSIMSFPLLIIIITRGSVFVISIIDCSFSISKHCRFRTQNFSSFRVQQTWKQATTDFLWYAWVVLLDLYCNDIKIK